MNITVQVFLNVLVSIPVAPKVSIKVVESEVRGECPVSLYMSCDLSVATGQVAIYSQSAWCGQWTYSSSLHHIPYPLYFLSLLFTPFIHQPKVVTHSRLFCIFKPTFFFAFYKYQVVISHFKFLLVF